MKKFVTNRSTGVWVVSIAFQLLTLAMLLSFFSYLSGKTNVYSKEVYVASMLDVIIAFSFVKIVRSDGPLPVAALLCVLAGATLLSGFPIVCVLFAATAYVLLLVDVLTHMAHTRSDATPSWLRLVAVALTVNLVAYPFAYWLWRRSVPDERHIENTA